MYLLYLTKYISGFKILQNKFWNHNNPTFPNKNAFQTTTFHHPPPPKQKNTSSSSSQALQMARHRGGLVASGQRDFTFLAEVRGGWITLDEARDAWEMLQELVNWCLGYTSTAFFGFQVSI